MLSRKNLDAFLEYGMLVLLLLMLVFAPLSFGGVPEWAFVGLQGLGMGVFLFWGLRLWLAPRPKLLWPPLAWAVATFFVYSIARYFTADIEYVARAEVAQVILYAFVFFAIINNLYGQEKAQAVSFTLITLATLISCYAVVQLVTHSDRVWNLHSGYVGRAGGTYISPNDLAGLIGMLLPLTLAYLLVGRLHIVTRILLVYAAAAMLAGLGVTFSRAGWVATSVGIFFVLVILLCHRTHRLRALILLLVMLVGGGLFVSKYLSKTDDFKTRVAGAVNGTPGAIDLTTRLELWRTAEKMWLDHFWWGVGPAHFDYRFPAYRPAIIQHRPVFVHNDYLNLLADWGTVGGVIVLAGMGIFIFGFIRIWPHVRRSDADFSHGQSNRFAFFLGAGGGLVSLTVHSAADFNLHIPANALVGVTLLALLAGNVRYATARYWFKPGFPIKLVLTVFLLAVIGAFAVDGWRRGHEAYWLAQADQRPDFSPEKTAALERAFAFEPQNFETAYDIGEIYRTQSFFGGDDYDTLAHQAMDWYTKIIHLDPYYAYAYLRMGNCLDWTDQHAASVKYYDQAEALDPNGYYTVAFIGWHYVQIGDFVTARLYFTRSATLDNSSALADNYLKICDKQLSQRASGKPTLPWGN